MRTFVLTAALVVANNVAFAQSNVTVKNMGGVSRDITDLEHRMVRGFGGVSRDVSALERQVANLRRQNAAAEKVLAKCEDKAIKSGKARSRFLARLGVCISQLGDVKRLSAKVASLESRMSRIEGRTDALDGRVSGVEGRADAMEEVAEDHRLRILGIEGRLAEGPEVALLAGPAVSRGGVPFNLGLGLSLPVAEGDARAETELLIGLRPEHLALTVRERVRQAGYGLVLGWNVMFLAQARTDLTAAREVMLGTGPSIGWSGERFGVNLDLAGGPDRVAKRGWGFGGSAGLTLVVKF